MKYPEFNNASCRSIGIDYYFGEEYNTSPSAEEKMAKALCHQCPVFNECREWAIKHEEFGIWGGTNMRDRAKIRRERGIKLQSILVSDYL